jgi:hypothetical protein
MLSETLIDDIAADLTRRSAAALADRRARGEIMTYIEDGWVLREFLGMRIERLCRVEDYKAADYPTPL